MLSQIPVDFSKVKKENLNKEILRMAIIAELDAINLNEQMAAFEKARIAAETQREAATALPSAYLREIFHGVIRQLLAQSCVYGVRIVYKQNCVSIGRRFCG